jgi:hypothetical protein
MKSLLLQAFWRNPQLHPQLGDNFNESVKFKVQGCFACEIAI